MPSQSLSAREWLSIAVVVKPGDIMSKSDGETDTDESETERLRAELQKLTDDV